MKTLVTGATGFIGSAIARELIQSGRSIRLLARENADLSNLDGLDAEIAYGDLRDKSSLEKALDGCSRLYHTAAYYSLWDRNKRLIYDINVEGTRNLFEAARQRKIEKIVYTSTVGCMGLLPGDKASNEETPFDPATLCNDYKISKYRAEALALEFNKPDLPIVIVNPTAPVGARDIKPTPTGKIILDFLNKKMPAYLDTGLNLIDVNDCARGHLLAEEKGIPGKRYILGNRNMSLKEILDTLETLTGLPAPGIRMPYWTAYAAGLACETFSNLITRKAPAVPLAGVKMARHHMYFDSSLAVRELGLPQNPVEDALSQAIEWFREKGLARN